MSKGIYRGNMDLNQLNLTTFPQWLSSIQVIGQFRCGDNHLTSLELCPNKVSGGFNCRMNQLTSLRGCPRELTSFVCSKNKLTTLRGGPRIVKGNVFCSDNLLTDLQGVAKVIAGSFVCSRNSVKFTTSDVIKVTNVERSIQV